MSFYLWGTGVFAKRIQNFFHRFCTVFPQYADNILDLKGVLDQSPSKQGEIFEKCVVDSPASVDWQHFSDYVIIALKFPGEVVDYLIRLGVSRNRIFLISDLFEWFCDKAYMTLYKVINENPKMFSTEQHKYFENLSFANQIIGYCNKEQFEDLVCFLEKNVAQMPLAAGVLDVCLEKNALQKFYQHLPSSNMQESATIKKVGIYYARYYNGGIERVMSVQIPMLISLGYQVVLFLDERDKSKEYPIPSGVECITLGKKDLGALAWYKKLCKAIEMTGVDVFYSHAYLTDAPMIPWVMHSFSVSLYTHIHTTFSALLNENFNVMKALYNQADSVAVLSRVDTLFWQTVGIKGIYLPNPGERLKITNVKRKDNTLLWCGRVEQYSKQVLDVIPIIFQVKKIVPDIKLLLVGGTDQPRVLQKLEKLIEENELQSNIILKGYAEDVSGYYQSAKICLITSRFEGFPMVLAEALSYGLPVVMYELPYLELRRECRGIECVPMRDIKQAAEKIVWLLQDEQAWLEHSKEAGDSIREFRENHDYKRLLYEFLNGINFSGESIFSEEDYKILVLTMLNSSINPIFWDYPI